MSDASDYNSLIKNMSDANRYMSNRFGDATSLLRLITAGSSVFPSRDENDLGSGLRLNKIDDEKINKHPHDNYSHLYRDGVKVSDHIFRLGGLSSGFTETTKNFMVLLLYPKLPSLTESYNCIINREGKIVLQAESQFQYLYVSKGIIGSDNKFYYNLLTGEKLCPYSSSATLSSDDFLFVEHKYGWYDKENKYELGVYKIEFKTGAVEIFPIVDKNQQYKNISKPAPTEEQLKAIAEKEAHKKLMDQYKHLGRNELCLCGSGLKFKNCHLLKLTK